MERAKWLHPAVLVLAILVALSAVLAAPVAWRRSQERARIRHSAQDILVLYHALQQRSRDLAGAAVIPDDVYGSKALRKRFGFPPYIPGAAFEKYQPDHPEFDKEILESPWAHDAIFFQLRLCHWQSLIRYVPLIPVMERHVILKQCLTDVTSQLKQEAESRGLYYEQWLAELARTTPTPLDPFTPDQAALPYRYWMDPMHPETESEPLRYPVWIVAGNGPDSQATLDEKRFHLEALGQPGVFDPRLGLGRNPVDLVYDPTNGTQSAGDIFLIDSSGPAIKRLDPALWDEEAFKQRYGLM